MFFRWARRLCQRYNGSVGFQVFSLVHFAKRALDSGRHKGSQGRAEDRGLGCTQAMPEQCLSDLKIQDIAPRCNIFDADHCVPCLCTSKKWTHWCGPSATLICGSCCIAQPLGGSWLLACFQWTEQTHTRLFLDTYLCAHITLWLKVPHDVSA